MLTRERIALRVLEEAGGSLSKTVFVKLMFLLRMESKVGQVSSFYDFVPYKFGPHSFALYRDIHRLELNGYLTEGDNYIALREIQVNGAQSQTRKLSQHVHFAVADVFGRYGRMQIRPLIEDVYGRYGWYALNSERQERKLHPIPPRPKANVAVFTVGYEGKSVDAFFNHLLREGIETIVDVRANPLSRKYGFAGSRMKKIGSSLGFGYQHFPTLGVPGSQRAALGEHSSYEKLFAAYEQTTLVQRIQDVKEVGKLMQRAPSVLVCVEKDVTCCHRSRLAQAIAHETGMEVIHL